MKRPSLTGFFASLGRAAAAKPFYFLAAWILILALGAIGARKAPGLLYGGSGDIPRSASLSVDSLLRTDFENPYGQLLVLAVSGYMGSGRGTASVPGVAGRARAAEPTGSVTTTEDSEAAELANALGKALKALPQTAAVMTPETVLDKRLLPKPGTGMAILVGLRAANVREAEQDLPKVRRIADSVLGAAKHADPNLSWAVTGRSALTYDLNRFNADDVTRAELRAVPITALILLLAFGSLAAAGMPVLMGLTCTTVSLGIISVLAQHWLLSNLVQNVASMIGLAVGIDYSLLIIQRYREELMARTSGAAGGGTGVTSGLLRAEALAHSMSTAGKAVFYSGLAVMIGMAGMLFTPLMEIRSIGWGGCAVVLVSLAAALTLLPSLLILLGPWLEWPKTLSNLFSGERRRYRWEAWSHWVLRRAPWAAALGLAAVALLSLPGRDTRFGFPEGAFIPAELEFSRGLAMLDSMGMQGLVRPIDIILTACDGRPLDSARIGSLWAFSARIRKDPAVDRIFGPVDLADDWPAAKYRQLYSDPEAAFERAPFVKEFFVSRDGKSLLMQVMLKPQVMLEQEKKLAKDIPGWFHADGMSLRLGGRAVYYNDFDKAMIASYAPSLAFVLAVTAALLLLFFRSPLVSFKAIAMNALSVAAGYGMVVFVFQQGHGCAFFGSPGPAQVVPLTIPLMLFCILFGLSMDYEVFLLSRIREAYRMSGDNRASVAKGLAATGPIITSAALIMAAVFGAFAFARVVVVQMLGLGLAVAVLVDATVIRILLVPAFMRLAGKWNWWPAGIVEPDVELNAPPRE